MALETVSKLALEVGEKVVKEGVKKGMESFKEGKTFKESLIDGLQASKESIFKEFDNYLSPENQGKISESTLKLSDIGEKIEFRPNEIIENSETVESEIQEIENNLTNIAEDLKDSGNLDEINESLTQFKEVLDHLKDIQSKLSDLGLNIQPMDLLSMLNSDGSETDEDDIEEGDAE